MKKISKLTAPKRSVALILALLLTAGTLIGCELAAAALDVADVAIKKSQDAARGRKLALNERIAGGVFKPKNPFENKVEERLLRRTSTLEGTLVDVTPYMFHEDSFAVLNDSLAFNKSIIDFTGNNSTSCLWEFDMTVTFKANNQPYKMELSGAACNLSKATDKNLVKNAVQSFVAEKCGVRAKDIKSLKIKFNAERRGNADFKWQVDGAFIQENEPGEYQFDVEVEYQKADNRLRTAQTTDFGTFTNVYRSGLKTLAAASINVQMAIWDQSRKLGFKDAPLPRVNFVKVAKIAE